MKIEEFVESRDAHSNAEVRAEMESQADAAASIEPLSREPTFARYRPFPTSLLPAEVSSFVGKASCAIGCDPSFVALPALSILAGVIGNSRRIKLKTGWEETPIIWTAIIGESGQMKTPAFRATMSAPRTIQGESLREHAEAEREYEAECMRHEVALRKWKIKGEGDPPEKPEEPNAQRLIIQDTTVEAIAPILEVNPRGLLLARDELDGWFGSFDRYSSGQADAAHWLSMYNAETLMVDRKTGKQTYFIPNACVSITGGIQPRILRRVLVEKNRENGIAARFHFSMPPRTSKQWTENEIPPQVKAQFAEIVSLLHQLEPDHDGNGGDQPRDLGLTPEAKEAFVSFFNEHAAETAELSGDLAAAYAKLEASAPRFALVFELVKNPASVLVGGESMTRGIALARWFAEEARRVYSMLSESAEEQADRELTDLIDRKGGNVTVRDVQRARREYQTSEEAEAAIQRLVDRGIGQWSQVVPTPRGGRPTRHFHLATEVDADKTSQNPINPEVVSASTVNQGEPGY